MRTAGFTTIRLLTGVVVFGPIGSPSYRVTALAAMVQPEPEPEVHSSAITRGSAIATTITAPFHGRGQCRRTASTAPCDTFAIFWPSASSRLSTTTTTLPRRTTATSW